MKQVQTPDTHLTTHVLSGQQHTLIIRATTKGKDNILNRTQDQLNTIWRDAKNGKFKDVVPLVPIVVVDDESEQVMSLPNQDGTERVVLSRKTSTGPWEVLL